jgi:hypothetical protein
MEERISKDSAEDNTSATFWHVWDKSGRRLFILGVILLFDIGLAIWALSPDPLEIAALFIGVGAMLRPVAEIMRQRNLLGGGTACRRGGRSTR